MPPLPDVLIVGGGAIGASCARALALAGAQVTVIDRPGVPAGEAWRASAGMLAAQVDARAGDPTLELGLAGREFLATSADALRRTTGIDIARVHHGILRVFGAHRRRGRDQGAGRRGTSSVPAGTILGMVGSA